MRSARARAAAPDDEWDYQRRRYRKAWCVLSERDVHPQSSAFVEEVLHKHRGLLKHLYRTFEPLRDEDRLLRRQPFGENVDIDAQACLSHMFGAGKYTVIEDVGKPPYKVSDIYRRITA